MTACEKEISYVVEKNDVVFVQVIEVQEHSNEILFSVLFQVDEQAIDDFIDDLALIPFTRVYGDPQGFSGDCFYIGYENEDYEIICTHYISRYDKNNNIIVWHNYEADIEQMNNLIDKYRFLINE